MEYTGWIEVKLAVKPIELDRRDVVNGQEKKYERFLIIEPGSPYSGKTLVLIWTNDYRPTGEIDGQPYAIAGFSVTADATGWKGGSIIILAPVRCWTGPDD